MANPKDFSKMFKNSPKDFSSNLNQKIGNPPELNSRPSFCLWSDLLGFGRMFFEYNWNPDETQKRKIHDRLLIAHSTVLYYSSPMERSMILNDGIAKVFIPKSRFEDSNNILSISLFLRNCVQLHMDVNSAEKANGYPGCRTVLSFGECIEYLANEIRFDDYVFNYSKPKGEEISHIAKMNGNPIIIYNPAELQMNTSFSKAYILESVGSNAGLVGNNFFIDKPVLNAIIQYATDKGYKPVWKELEDSLQLLIPYQESNLDKVVLGFDFDKNVISVDVSKYKSSVYELMKFHPHDELIGDFSFELFNNETEF